MVQTELVTAAQRGDAEAFAALARLSADRLSAVRVTRDRHRAEDALQQALIAAWKELPRLRDPERFEAWTYRLIVRFAVQEARGGQSSRRSRPFPFPLPRPRARPHHDGQAPGSRCQVPIELGKVGCVRQRTGLGPATEHEAVEPMRRKVP